MENQTTFDKFSNFLFDTLDTVNKGVGTYFDGAIKYNQAQAALNSARSQRDAKQTIDELSVGSDASAWGNVGNDTNGLSVSGQSLLIAAGLGLALFAVVRS
ncbi:MAG: hypothetical protein ACRBDL_03415 [Alphaproteobacteria bacterium]